MHTNICLDLCDPQRSSAEGVCEVCEVCEVCRASGVVVHFLVRINFKFMYSNRVLLGKPEGKWPLGRPRCRWVDNIRMDLQEVGYGYMDWIELAQDRDRWRNLVSAVKSLRVP